MALDELHARRLMTVMTVVENALDRIEHLLEAVEEGKYAGNSAPPPPSDLRKLRVAAGQMRQRLQAAAERFEVRSSRPHWRQQLTAELSTLWVVLENAMPRRMKGYGREFTADDRADWEGLIRDLLHDIESMRTVL